MFKISKTNRWAGSCGWSCVLNLHGRPMTTANIFLQFLARADNEKNTLKTSDVWQTDKCDIRIKNISTVWAWKVTWRGFKCAEKDRKFEIGRILDLDWKALRWEFISTLTQKRKCDITQRTEKETREQEAFSWRRSGYLRPNWYINRTHRHVCRIEDLETVSLYPSPFCATL